jgi:hypothetical protein
MRSVKAAGKGLIYYQGFAKVLVINPGLGPGEVRMGIYRRYEWTHQGINFYYEITWPDEWLSSLEHESHDIMDTSEYGYYVDNDSCESELEDFFEKIIELGEEHLEISESKDVLQYLLSFVQHLNYHRERGEYPRYPTETIIDKGGDCEDTAILMAFITGNLGYDRAFFEFSNEGFLGIGEFAHVDLGICQSYDREFSGDYWTGKDGRDYYYVSCNGRGREIGDYSGQWGNRASVYPI